jgi:hypothetical protein
MPFPSVLSFGIDSSLNLGMGTFFRGIKEAVLSLFRGIFSERNSVDNPTKTLATRGVAVAGFAARTVLTAATEQLALLLCRRSAYSAMTMSVQSLKSLVIKGTWSLISNDRWRRNMTMKVVQGLECVGHRAFICHIRSPSSALNEQYQTAHNMSTYFE